IAYTVVALDQFNNIDTGYAHTVNFTTTDSQASLQTGQSTLLSGVGSFAAILRTAGNATINAVDAVNSGISGSVGPITVMAAEARRFIVSAPASATAGVGFTAVVTAQDQFNNTASGYEGMVHFTSGDTQATLPADSTLTNGKGTVNATLR